MAEKGQRRRLTLEQRLEALDAVIAAHQRRADAARAKKDEIVKQEMERARGVLATLER